MPAFDVKPPLRIAAVDVAVGAGGAYEKRGDACVLQKAASRSTLSIAEASIGRPYSGHDGLAIE